MKEVTKIVFHKEEYITNRIDEAFRLVGGASWDEMDRRQKPFRKIRGNDASLEDCREAAAIVQAEVTEQLELYKTAPCPFPEMEPGSTRIEDTWREGQFRNLHRAKDRAESFLELVEEGLSEQSD